MKLFFSLLSVLSSKPIMNRLVAQAVSINNLPGSPAPSPPGARQSLSIRFSPNRYKKLKWHCKQKTAKMHCLKQHSFCSSRHSRGIFCNFAEQKTSDLNLAEQVSRKKFFFIGVPGSKRRILALSSQR